MDLSQYKEDKIKIQFYYQKVQQQIQTINKADKTAFTQLDEIEKKAKDSDDFVQKLKETINPKYLQFRTTHLKDTEFSFGKTDKKTINEPNTLSNNQIHYENPNSRQQNQMPPPQNNPESIDVLDNNLLSQIGINEKDEDYNQYASILQANKNSNFIKHSGSSKDDFLLNQRLLKTAIENKLSKDKVVKDFDVGCIETIEIAFQFFIKNNLNKLCKFSILENEQDNIYQNQIENQQFYSEVNRRFIFFKNENRRSLLKLKKIVQKKEEYNKKINIIYLENPQDIQKKIDKIDRQEQLFIEDAIKNKNYFDEMFTNNRIQADKKVKKYLEDELYKLFLKQNQEINNDQLEINKKNTEDTQKAIEIFRNFGTQKNNEQNVQEQHQQNQLEDQKKSRRNKNRISLRSVIVFLETFFQRSRVLVKAYNQANI